ncbi:UDP-N-acetylmuramate--alanine ligase [Propionibacterium cyclohexanicum]|uniref:UDP-N-acetylmuramate--L-alanine ligase n=1 Tax=Propionibacterium cyclohexanicum TaxID=64702 RepID=A0A1H9PJ80_9ACTN|nr:UDP-N-acetylmuramate--L-alanine ligase [Propionibacterium cyclohexanicum]SER48356.1 UDP-N-acetylmuramate--alanine ligase [Propionibacterium cyclohexanicum]
MTLLEPVPLVVPERLGAVHFLAMGGSGMSGVALAYHERGVPVSGCDQVDSPTLRQLGAEGILSWTGHDAAHLQSVDTVVVSSAIRHDNVELAEARRRGLRVWHRSAALAALMLGHDTVSVAGTHGKTTTTSMIATMATVAGAEPSYVIGSPLASTGQSAHIGTGRPFVVEADESDGSFLQYPTRIAVITNIEADHLDNWGTASRYAEGFERFAKSGDVEAVVIDADDPGAQELAERLRDSPARGRTVISYGENPRADVRLRQIVVEGMHASAQLDFEGRTHELHLTVPGRHNLWNAAGAFAAGRLLGLPAEDLLRGASAFTGNLRRFQPVGHVQLPDGRLSVFDDYAHHPTEIRAALSAARRAVRGGRLVACFQPHLYSRTQEFAQEFGRALALADLAVVTDVYGAREDPLPGVTGQLVADAARAAGIETHYVADKTRLPAELARLVRGKDLLMTLGAGDITLVGPMLVRQLGGFVAGSRR